VSPTPSDVNTGALPILGVQNYATVEIYDDGDAAGVFGFDRSESMSISEKSGEIVLTVTRTNGMGGDAIVRYATVCVECTHDQGRYTPALHPWIKFENGVTQRVLKISILDNYATDGDAIFNVHLTTVTGSGGAATILPSRKSLQVTVVDDEIILGQIGFQRNVYNCTEDSGFARSIESWHS